MDSEDGYFRTLTSLLKKIKRVKLDQVVNVVERFSNSEVKAVEDLAFNILKGNIPLEGPLKEKAAANKDLYKQLTSKKSTIGQRRQILQDNPKFTRSLANIGLEALDDTQEQAS